MKHLLTCHCKKIKIEVNFEGEISNLVKCNCSICKRKGAVMGIVGQDSLKIIEGEKYITNYKFHSKVANHFFLLNLRYLYSPQSQTRPNIIWF